MAIFAGTTGADTITGTDEADGISLFSGNDIAYGGIGADSLFGGDGSDTLYGGADGDTIDGGTGDDLIVGGTGDDFLRGAAGNDTYRFAGNFGRDRIQEAGGPAGADTDTIVLAGYRKADIYFHTPNANDLVIRFYGLREQITIVDYFRQSTAIDLVTLDDGQIDLNAGLTIGGVEGDDVVYGGPAADRLRGGTGIDTIQGREGDDSIEGGEGADILYGDSVTGTLGGNDRIDGGSEGDRLYGGVGHDWLEGGEDDDTLYGGEGEDTLFGGIGDDTLEGGSGSDTYRMAGRFGTDRIVELTSGAGEDQVQFTFALKYARFASGNELGGDYRDLVIEDTRTGDSAILVSQLTAMNVELLRFGSRVVDLRLGMTMAGTDAADNLFGGTEADTITGLLSVDTLTGGSGDDRLYGGAGRDRLFGGLDEDLLDGGSEADLLSGGGDRDTLFGGTGADTLLGEDGDDSLFGGDNADTLDGGNGEDLLAGGAGRDTLRGGQNGDTYVWNIGDGIDIIEEAPGGTGLDVLAFGDGILRSEVVLWRTLNADGSPGPHLVVEFTNRDGQIIITDQFVSTRIETIRFANGQTIGLAGSYDLALGGTNGDDDITGTDGSQTIIGRAGSDFIRGMGGNDLLSGGNGFDLLDGGAGNDTLRGGAEEDILIGGAGLDQLWGGSGADRFTFLDRFDGDVIRDFDRTEDILDFRQNSFFTSRSQVIQRATEGAGFVDIVQDADNVIRIWGIAKADLALVGFLF